MKNVYYPLWRHMTKACETGEAYCPFVEKRNRTKSLRIEVYVIDNKRVIDNKHIELRKKETNNVAKKL